MNLTFLKSHWFPICMGCIIVLAIFRNGIPAFLGGNGAGSKKKKTEKLTEATAATEGKSLFGFLPAAAQPDDKNTQDLGESAEAFLKRFGSVAVGERKKFGIPASVLLACAYVNSQGGRAETAKTANNYFGLPCSDDWEGDETEINDGCYRMYKTPWESFRDFSIHLTGCEWYAALRKSAGKDWKSWVKGIKASDVSSVPGFNEKIRNVITSYRLFELDPEK